jgi:ATP-dependent Lon protease
MSDLKRKRIIDEDDIVNASKRSKRSNRSSKQTKIIDKYLDDKYLDDEDLDDEDLDDEDLDDEDYDPDYDPDLDEFIVPDTFVEYDNRKMTPKSKKKKMTTIQEKELNKILDEFDNKTMSEFEILKSNLSSNDKLECYELMRVMKQIKKNEGEIECWLTIRNKLFNKINKSNPFTKEDHNELIRLKKIVNVDLSLEHKIIRSKHPDEIKLKIYEKYNSIKNLSIDDETRGKYEDWINKCLNLPSDTILLTSLYKNCIEMLSNVKNKMDTMMYGQDLVKERILEVLTSMWTNPSRSKNCMVFLGKPGVGKTALARNLATSTGLPYYQISFGGSKDSSILKGHGLTYISSTPGEIVEALISMKIKNGILFLDELDKIQNQEMINTLLHILDYTQNSEFKDNYLQGVPIDLSKLIIIASINSLDTLGDVLADRLPIIQFKDYTVEDKVNIGLTYLVPSVIDNLSLDKRMIKYDKSSVAYIMEKTNIKEAGVRQLERNISTIFDRLNVLIQIHKSKKKFMMSYDIPNMTLPITLNKNVIDILFEEYQYKA